MNGWEYPVHGQYNFDSQVVEGSGFTIEKNGGPDGNTPAIGWTPLSSSSSLTLNLPKEINLRYYDGIRLAVFYDGAPVQVSVELQGWPDENTVRVYYLWKRDLKVAEWDDVRLDLHRDDCGEAEVCKPKEAARKLKISFCGSNTAIGGAVVRNKRVKISNIRFCRRMADINLDYRKAAQHETEKGLDFIYKISVRSLLLEKALFRFNAELPDGEGIRVAIDPPSSGLESGASTEIKAVLSCPRKILSKQPAGKTWRALLKASIDGLNGYDEYPLIGYRPAYLWAVVPPEKPVSDLFALPTDEVEKKKILDQAAKELPLFFELPEPGVKPAWPPLFTCPECRERPKALDNKHFRCVNAACPEKDKIITGWVLERAYAGILNASNMERADTLAAAALLGAGRQYSAKAIEILERYAADYQRYPKVNERSTGYSERLQSAGIFTHYYAVPAMKAYRKLIKGGFMSDEQKENIKRKFLLEIADTCGIHVYAYASGDQVKNNLLMACYAALSGEWLWLARALDDVAGLRNQLKWGLDADTAPLERGAYAGIAANDFNNAMEIMKRIGVSFDSSMLESMRKSCLAMGIISGTPLERLNLPVTVLENSGFTLLAAGKGSNRTMATINWGTFRDRGESDFLTYEIANPEGAWLNETGHMAYNYKNFQWQFRSLAHPVVIIGARDSRQAPCRQIALSEGPGWSAALYEDSPGDALFKEGRIRRALFVAPGLCLVLDEVRLNDGAAATSIDRTYLPLADPEIEGAGAWTKFPEKLGTKAGYEYPFDLSFGPVKGSFKLSWPIVKGHGFITVKTLFEPAEAGLFSGKAYAGRQVNESPFVMMRTRGNMLTLASLYSLNTDKAASIGLERIPVAGIAGKEPETNSVFAYRVLTPAGSRDVIFAFVKGSFKTETGLQVKGPAVNSRQN